MTKKQNSLLSFHILEREGDNNLITWNYPTVSENIRNFLQTKCFGPVKRQDAFYVLGKNNVKVFVRHCENEKKRFAIVLVGERFEYNKFRILSEVLAKAYLKQCNPVSLVKMYLKLFTAGTIDVQENGSQKSNYVFKDFKEETKIKDLIVRFGLETIFLYTAILLKRRILVYHDDIERMQKELHTICRFISARNLDFNLYPFVENASEVRGLSCYLAGTTNDTLINNGHIYDICLNFAVNDIVISSEAKDTFLISKTQEEIAHSLIKFTEEDYSEIETIAFIDEKTEELLEQVKSLCNFTTEQGHKVVTVDELKSKNFKPALENFLFNLAAAEDRLVL